jgi:hypothetical protein
VPAAIPNSKITAETDTHGRINEYPGLLWQTSGDFFCTLLRNSGFVDEFYPGFYESVRPVREGPMLVEFGIPDLLAGPLDFPPPVILI